MSNPLSYEELSEVYRLSYGGQSPKVRQDLYPALTKYLDASYKHLEACIREGASEIIIEGARTQYHRDKKLAETLIEARIRMLKRYQTIPSESLNVITPEERAYMVRLRDLDAEFRSGVL